MTEKNKTCVHCGFVEEEHSIDGLTNCPDFDPELRPRVHIPESFDAVEYAETGRKSFRTHDPTRDYMVVEVPSEDWTAAYLLGEQSGGFVVAEVRVYPTEPDTHRVPGTWSFELDRVPEGGLSGRRLRQFGSTEYRNHMDLVLAAVRKKMGDEAFEEFTETRELSADYLSSLSDGSRLSSDRATRLAQIAGLYVSAVTAGDRSPVASVADQLGMSRPSVRDRLHDARELGLLERATAGKAGGKLSPRALELLRVDGKDDEQ